MALEKHYRNTTTGIGVAHGNLEKKAEGQNETKQNKTLNSITTQSLFEPKEEKKES